MCRTSVNRYVRRSFWPASLSFLSLPSKLQWHCQLTQYASERANRSDSRCSEGLVSVWSGKVNVMLSARFSNSWQIENLENNKLLNHINQTYHNILQELVDPPHNIFVLFLDFWNSKYIIYLVVLLLKSRVAVVGDSSWHQECVVERARGWEFWLSIRISSADMQHHGVARVTIFVVVLSLCLRSTNANTGRGRFGDRPGQVADKLAPLTPAQLGNPNPFLFPLLKLLAHVFTSTSQVD